MSNANLPPLDHKPLRPPRAGHIGEQVYASMWNALLAANGEQIDPYHDFEDPLAVILEHFPKTIAQRHATVCASVVCWLGTACGRGFIYQARKIAERGAFSTEDSFLIAWTLENYRLGFVNHGGRTLEFLLAPSHGQDDGPSADDYEVAEHVARWLGCPDGEMFVASCKEEIRRLQKTERLKRYAEKIRIDAWNGGVEQ